MDRYFSPEVWKAECQALFGPLPLIAAHTSQLAPGQVLTHDSFGVPLLLSRDTDGTLRCFFNVCRHRGMRLMQASDSAQAKSSVVCPFHGWAYQLDGSLRQASHLEAFDACPGGERNLVQIPCEERHGLIWVVPSAEGNIDLDKYLGNLNEELPFYGIDKLKHFHTVETEYPANWKFVMEAFLESYHFGALHKKTISPFYANDINSSERVGPHVHSLVARESARAWAKHPGSRLPRNVRELSHLATTSMAIFPNTTMISQPEYISLISVTPTGPESLRWTHRILIPADKATPELAPQWMQVVQQIEQLVFQREDLHCAINVQRGLKTGVNSHLTTGRDEVAIAWFHEEVQRAMRPY